MPTDAGFSIGKFRVVRELGRGAMGIVYEAFQDDLARRAAVKVIAPELLADQTQQERFLREARLAASVQHPGIVAIYEAGVDQGRAFVAMELVEGQPLGALPPDALAPHEAARLVAEVARAVAAMHEHGVVHRDLKPDNILVDADGHARVTDFGLATLRDDDDLATAAGTPGYMAPEQITARFGSVGPRSDVYALGAVLHLLLTGQRPHDAGSVMAVVMATIEREASPTPPPGVPAALYAICRRCLERRPEQRYASAAALAQDLERFLQGEATEAVPAGVLRRAQSFCRRRRALSARLLALLAFAVLAAVDYLLGTTPTWYFVEILAVLAALTLGSLALDWLSRRRRISGAAHLLWTTIDVVGLTWVLARGDGLRSPLLILLPVVVVAAGAWLDVRTVAFATVATVAGYGVLVATPSPWVRVGIDQHLAVVVTLLVTGVLVGLQAARARALRDYAARQR